MLIDEKILYNVLLSYPVPTEAAVAAATVRSAGSIIVHFLSVPFHFLPSLPFLLFLVFSLYYPSPSLLNLARVLEILLALLADPRRALPTIDLQFEVKHISQYKFSTNLC